MSEASQLRVKRLQEFLAKDPNDSFSRYAIGLELYKSGEIKEAISYFEELIKRDPDYVGTYYQLGKIFVSAGKAEKAEKIFRDGIAISSKSGNTHAKSELMTALNELLNEDGF